ncbi:MAG TPA: hypothetical protein VLJ57_00950 [Burkholderiaceae bacterium]|nr:hypothetical protein [Burkholderiaceae bacterium]
MSHSLNAFATSIRRALPRAGTHASHALGWFAVVAAGSLLAAASCAAEPRSEEGLLLRPGEWRQDVGSYLLPAGLQGQPQHWPLDGWYRVTHKTGLLDVRAVKKPAQGLPGFLHDIAVQVTDPSVQDMVADAAEAIDTQYIRVPGARLTEGHVPTVRFSNTALRPRLGHPYALQLGDTSFTLTVHNGLRSKAGVAYGQGAQYVVTYGGATYTYLLGEFGWDSIVQAVADLDGDGKPDFIVHVGGSNRSDEFLLLSTRARPGLNQPTATLSAQGC